MADTTNSKLDTKSFAKKQKNYLAPLPPEYENSVRENKKSAKNFIEKHDNSFINNIVNNNERKISTKNYSITISKNELTEQSNHKIDNKMPKILAHKKNSNNYTTSSNSNTHQQKFNKFNNLTLKNVAPTILNLQQLEKPNNEVIKQWQKNVTLMVKKNSINNEQKHLEHKNKKAKPYLKLDVIAQYNKSVNNTQVTSKWNKDTDIDTRGFSFYF